jgi:hypothetical protein
MDDYRSIKDLLGIVIVRRWIFYFVLLSIKFNINSNKTIF